MPQTQATPARSHSWSLEVVRGRDVGKVLVVMGPAIVLGNGVEAGEGIDLRDQESGSPRRMAARQAVLEARDGELTIRDLDSPGGTFVNRQRLLGGQARRLRSGDEIQVGGVVLRLGTPPDPPPTDRVASARLPEPFAIGGVTACRTWDDFPIVAAQRWGDLRAELTSGRVADYLRRIRRTDLLPVATSGASADEQLDDWLGRLPVSRPALPELEVHPDTLEVPAGTTRHVLRVANVGLRLLRSTARVEPSGTRWVRIAPPHDRQAFVTIDETELAVEVEAPDGRGGPPFAEVVIASNGGTRRIGVRLRSPGPAPQVPEAIAPAAGIPDAFRILADAVSTVPPTARVAIGALAGLTLRMSILAAALIPVGSPGDSPLEPKLAALAVLGAAVGGMMGLLAGWRGRRPPGEAATAGVAAGLAGILAAVVLHALVRTVDGWSASWWAVALVWAALGAAVAGFSCLLLPHSSRAKGGPE